MTISEYRNQFVELFKKMQQEHGICNSVHIDNCRHYKNDGTFEIGEALCTINF